MDLPYVLPDSIAAAVNLSRAEKRNIYLSCLEIVRLELNEGEKNRGM